MKRLIAFFNLWVLVTSMLSLNLNIKGSIDQLVPKDILAQAAEIKYNHFAPESEDKQADALTTLGINLHPGSEFTQEDSYTSRSLNHCKSLVYRTLKSLPEEAVKKLQHLTLYFSDEGRRGLGGGSTIILRCKSVTDKELVGVLVHEMGHITDTGLLQGTSLAGESEFNDGTDPVYNDDPSVGFYRLSFLDEHTLRPENTQLDFVSGYAMSDPFEDFAESYNYYILHGYEYRRLMQTSEVLRAKYNFLKNQIFQGKEFFNGNTRFKRIELIKREYDTTILPYNLNKFWLT